MKRLIESLLIVFLLVFICCDDVFVEDISDDSISPLAPVNNSQLTGNAVQFRWSTLEGADNYSIQIIGGQENIILDSLVSSTVFDYQINPGTYRWRIRGENFAYVTPYTPISIFTISPTNNLTDQLITLLSPSNNIYLKSDEIAFSWQGIINADSYHFKLLEKDGTNETQVFEIIEVLDNSLTFTSGLTDDAEYIWEVKAQNSTSSTSFFRRSFFLDRQAPPVPSLEGPDNEQNYSVDDQISFTWDFQDSGNIQSNISGNIEIASDQNFNTIVLSNTAVSEEFSTSFTSSGTFYWRVFGEDEAGNVGDVSSSRSFTIN